MEILHEVHMQSGVGKVSQWVCFIFVGEVAYLCITPIILKSRQETRASNIEGGTCVKVL